LRYDRMSGLDSEQLDELVWRIEDQLEEPWHKGIGRPKDLTLREAAVVACGYMRQNITQEVWAEIFDTSQPVISGIIAKFTPLIEASTEEDRPTVDEAKEAAVREQTVLVDGFLAPTWSWRDTPELWSGKHKTTGFNGQVIASLRGDLLFVSEPITGHNHDMTALAETETADIIAAAYSGIGDKGYQGSDFITPFKKPQGGELLEWQKEFNVQVNKLRAPVERMRAGQVLPHEPDRHRPLADRGRDSLDRAGVDVAHREDPGLAGLQEVRPLAVESRELLVVDIGSGQHEPVLIQRDVAAQPLRVRRRADEHEQRLDREL